MYLFIKYIKRFKIQALADSHIFNLCLDMCILCLALIVYWNEKQVLSACPGFPSHEQASETSSPDNVNLAGTADLWIRR